MSEGLKKHCKELIDEYKKLDALKRTEFFPKIKAFYDYIDNYDKEVMQHFDNLFSKIVFEETPKIDNEFYNFDLSNLLQNETQENDFKLKFLLGFNKGNDEYKNTLTSTYYEYQAYDYECITNRIILYFEEEYGDKFEKILSFIPNYCSDVVNYEEFIFYPNFNQEIDEDLIIRIQNRFLEIINTDASLIDFNMDLVNRPFNDKYGDYIKNHYNILKDKFLKNCIYDADKGRLTQTNNFYVRILLANEKEIKDNFLDLFNKISQNGEYECLSVGFVNHLIEDYYSYKDILLEKHIDILKSYTFILSNVENQIGYEGQLNFACTFDPNVLIPFIEIAKRDFNSIETTNEINNIINELANYYINCNNDNYNMYNGVFEDNIDYKISIEVLKELCEINDRDYCEVLDYMAELDPSFKNTPEYESEYVGQQLKHF